jgi:hypothetical protein
MHVVAPPTSVSASLNENAVTLHWTPANDSIEGYHVYRAATPHGPFHRLNNNLVLGTTFIDSNSASGSYTYMVRAAKLETSASGSYLNLSEGEFAPAMNSQQNIAVITSEAPLAENETAVVDAEMLTAGKLSPTGNLAGE